VALQMIRPTRHSKSGTYRLRLTDPPGRRDIARALMASGRSLSRIYRLGTPERRSRSLAPAAIARLEERLRVLHDDG
jgi:hypothetical protein